MKTIIDKRLKFNKAFNLPTATEPTEISEERVQLQYNMMLEELTEYKEANNIVERADALIDQFEILLGMFAEHGMLSRLTLLYDEVHRSNMSKLDDNGKPIINGENGVFYPTRPLGKVIKSKNFKEPEFGPVLTAKLTDKYSQFPDESDVRFIVKTIEKYTLKTVDEFSTCSRERRFLEPRQLCMYFLHNYTRHSTTSIASFFNSSTRGKSGKHHSTVLNAKKTVEDLVDTNKDFNILFNKIKAEIVEFISK